MSIYKIAESYAGKTLSNMDFEMREFGLANPDKRFSCSLYITFHNDIDSIVYTTLGTSSNGILNKEESKIIIGENPGEDITPGEFKLYLIDLLVQGEIKKLGITINGYTN